MVSILLAGLLASTAAAANITTSIWLPGLNLENSTVLASVVERQGENTIMSLAFTAQPKNTEYGNAPPTVTVAGTTRVAFSEIVSDEEASGSVPPVTVGLDCTRASGGPSAVPTCKYSTIGADFALSAVCSGLTVSSLPEYCTSSKGQVFTETYTLSGESQYYLNNYPLIITAGTEKVDATAAGTPRSSGATPTGASGSPRPSGASGSPSQAAGGAAPMRSLVPALAGLGAAAAIFF